MLFASLLPAASLKDAWEPTSRHDRRHHRCREPTGQTTRGRVAASAGRRLQGRRRLRRHLEWLIKEPKRAWIGQLQPAAEYANGPRFFAYRALRWTLTCRELTGASHDFGGGDGPPAPSSDVTAAQAASALSLARAVKTELMSERAGRCSASQSQA
jgi:hypothetical protein